MMLRCYQRTKEGSRSELQRCRGVWEAGAREVQGRAATCTWRKKCPQNSVTDERSRTEALKEMPHLKMIRWTRRVEDRAWAVDRYKGGGMVVWCSSAASPEIDDRPKRARQA